MLRKEMHFATVFKSLKDSGGAEVIAQNQLHILRSLGVRLTVLARQGNAGTQDCEFVKVNPLHFGRLGRVGGFARAVCRKVQDLNADLVLSQEYMPCCHVYWADGGAHAEWLRQQRRTLGFWGRLWQGLDRSAPPFLPWR